MDSTRSNSLSSLRDETVKNRHWRSSSKDFSRASEEKIKQRQEQINTGERIVLNVGGKKFETYVSTLQKYPDSLLGTMFHSRNMHLRKADTNGEYFFDRSSLGFEAIINFYRTGRLRQPPGVSASMLEDEVDYWQIPQDAIYDDIRLGNKLSIMAIENIRKKVGPILFKIRDYIVDKIESAASEGLQSFSIEFKESSEEHQAFYAFLSNFSNRELLLHDLLAENFDVSFNDMTSVQGHSYILFITLWNRYTMPIEENLNTSVFKILEEIRAGVEIKTNKDDHIITTRNVNI